MKIAVFVNLIKESYEEIESLIKELENSNIDFYIFNTKYEFESKNIYLAKDLISAKKIADKKDYDYYFYFKNLYNADFYQKISERLLYEKPNFAILKHIDLALFKYDIYNIIVKKELDKKDRSFSPYDSFLYLLENDDYMIYEYNSDDKLINNFSDYELPNRDLLIKILNVFADSEVDESSYYSFVTLFNRKKVYEKIVFYDDIDKYVEKAYENLYNFDFEKKLKVIEQTKISPLFLQETTNEFIDEVIEKFLEKIRITYLKYYKDKMIIGIKTYLPKLDLNISLLIDDKKYKFNKIDVYQVKKYFLNREIEDKVYELVIDIDKIKDKKLFFECNYQDVSINSSLEFDGFFSRLNNFNNSVWPVKDIILINHINYIEVKKNNFFRRNWYLLKRHFNYYKYLKGSSKSNFFKSLVFRFVAKITKPFTKKTWLTSDKLYKAGDCGESFARYVNNNCKNVKMVYIINKNSKDVDRLKKEGFTLRYYKTKKLRLDVLRADAVFHTHAGTLSFLSIKGHYEYYKDMFNWDSYCIQHGLTIQDMAMNQNSYKDQLDIHFVATEKEKENMSRPEYHMRDNMVRITGMARFDDLYSKPKNVVLFAPTWRQSLANKPSMGNPRAYIDDFKETNYFNIYNDLMNSKEMLDVLKKNNFKLKFILHPTFAENTIDFDENEYVEVIKGSEADYVTLMEEADIMVTDYSGVQFDFAVMEKPLIYFHTDRIPYEYEYKGMDIEKEGFGKIVDNEEDLIKEIDNLIKNGISDKYLKRIRKFFKYTDHNACKRIVEEVEKYEKN